MCAARHDKTFTTKKNILRNRSKLAYRLIEVRGVQTGWSLVSHGMHFAVQKKLSFWLFSI